MKSYNVLYAIFGSSCLILLGAYGNSVLNKSKIDALNSNAMQSIVAHDNNYSIDSEITRLENENRDLRNKVVSLASQIQLRSEMNEESHTLSDETRAISGANSKQADLLISNAMDALSAAQKVIALYNNGEEIVLRDFMRNAFDEESRLDDGWQAEYESALSILFGQDSNFIAYDVYDIECRKSNCYVQISANSQTSANSIASKLRSNMSAEKYPKMHSIQMAYDPNLKILDLYIKPTI